jgi:hypothetical protein
VVAFREPGLGSHSVQGLRASQEGSKRVQTGAQSGCELRFYAYAIGLKEVGLVRADCVSGHESSKRVQCGEPVVLVPDPRYLTDSVMRA